MLFNSKFFLLSIRITLPVFFKLNHQFTGTGDVQEHIRCESAPVLLTGCVVTSIYSDILDEYSHLKHLLKKGAESRPGSQPAAPTPLQ